VIYVWIPLCKSEMNNNFECEKYQVLSQKLEILASS